MVGDKEMVERVASNREGLNAVGWWARRHISQLRGDVTGIEDQQGAPRGSNGEWWGWESSLPLPTLLGDVSRIGPIRDAVSVVVCTGPFRD